MATEDPQLAKLKKLEALLAVATQDAVSPGDLGEVVKLILEILVKVKGELKDLIDNEKSERGDLGEGIDKQLEASFGAVGRDIQAVEKKAAAALLWIDEQKKKKLLDDDVARALELGHENEDEIARVERMVNDLSREPGPRGPRGKMPRHKWVDTTLYFENPDGSWGDGIDLKGDPGQGGGFSFFGGAGMGGVRTIRAGSTNVHLNSIDGDIVITVDNSGGGGGTSITIEEPPEAPDDTTTVFTFTQKPLAIVMNGATYREDHGWTWDSLNNQATMFSPVGTPQNPAGDIYAFIQS